MKYPHLPQMSQTKLNRSPISPITIMTGSAPSLSEGSSSSSFLHAIPNNSIGINPSTIRYIGMSSSIGQSFRNLNPGRNREYQMSVGLILNLLNELNKYIMWASDEHNIILFNKINRFSNEPARIIFYLSHTPKRTL